MLPIYAFRRTRLSARTRGCLLPRSLVALGSVDLAHLCIKRCFQLLPHAPIGPPHRHDPYASPRRLVPLPVTGVSSSQWTHSVEGGLKARPVDVLYDTRFSWACDNNAVHREGLGKMYCHGRLGFVSFVNGRPTSLVGHKTCFACHPSLANNHDFVTTQYAQ